MATTVSGVSVKTTVACTSEKTVDLATTKDVLSQAYTTTYTNGTGSGNVNKAWHDTRTLVASGNETIDLSDLTDVFGEAISFTTIKDIFIKNEGTTELLVGGAASNAVVACFNDATDKVVIPAGGRFHWNGGAAGVALSTSINLKIENSDTATAAEYDIILLGVSS